jgi:hypothetical protein
MQRGDIQLCQRSAARFRYLELAKMAPDAVGNDADRHAAAGRRAAVGHNKSKLREAPVMRSITSAILETVGLVRDRSRRQGYRLDFRPGGNGPEVFQRQTY